MKWLVVLFIVVLSTSSVKAQDTACGYVDTGGYGECRNDFGCYNIYPLQIVQPCVDPYTCPFQTLQNQQCCFTFVQLWLYSGRCDVASLRNEKTRKAMLRLTKEFEILLPSCNGALVPADLVLRRKRDDRS